MQKPIYGIDYGSKLAGTTVVAFASDGKLLTKQSVKKQDADAMLLTFFAQMEAGLVGIDAPLSLPPGLLGRSGGYFFRKADLQLHAMSPMFLGGLTARAIYLRDLLVNKGFQVHEIYPKALAHELGLLRYDYKSKNNPSEKIISFLKNLLPLPMATIPINWHQFDAILAWYSAWRIANGCANQFGDINEGIIYV